MSLEENSISRDSPPPFVNLLEPLSFKKLWQGLSPWVGTLKGDHLYFFTGAYVLFFKFLPVIALANVKVNVAAVFVKLDSMDNLADSLCLRVGRVVSFLIKDFNEAVKFVKSSRAITSRVEAGSLIQRFGLQ